jgi:hypothetical protein
MVRFDDVDRCLNWKVDINEEKHQFWNIMGDESEDNAISPYD